MTPSFEILSPNIDTTVAELFIEIGLHGIAYIVVDDSTQCKALAVYPLPANAASDAAAAAIRSIVAKQHFLQDPFRKINIIYAYPFSVLVPYRLMKDELNKDILEMIHGDVQDIVIKKDYLYRHQLYNIYGVPRQVDTTVEYLLAADNAMHLYSLLADVDTGSNNSLYCIFNNCHFTALLKKEGKLQLVQTFGFKTPEDAAYYLLHICNSFNIAPAAVHLQLQGMIDPNSALYTEISKYFLNLHFGQLPGSYIYPEGIKAYPAHFFSHLFATALCV